MVAIGLNYLFYMPDFHTIPFIDARGITIAWVFMLTGLVGQMAIFAFMAGAVAMILVLILPPRRWIAFLIDRIC